jgi:peptidylprolyl isomerase
MRTLGKKERIAVAAAIIATAILFFGHSIWGFLVNIGGQGSANRASEDAANQAKAANISTVEGLEIYDMKLGEGEEAVPGKIVSAHYVGRLASDGVEFDSSYARGTPYTFKLGTGQVIKGWHLGIEGMKEGGVRQLIIPPEYAYGAAGFGKIPPNSTLIFQVELVDVQ